MTLPAAFDQAISQVRRNPRLQVGLALALGIVWLYGILILTEKTDTRLGEIAAAQTRLARLQADAGQIQWPQRVEAAKAMQIAEEARLWHESTPGLARAAFQDWLNQILRAAGIDKANLSMGSQEAGAPAQADAAGPAAADGLWKVTTQLSFPFSPDKAHALLAALAEHPEMVVVETLTLRTSPSPQAELALAAWFRKQAEAKP